MLILDLQGATSILPGHLGCRRPLLWRKTPGAEAHVWVNAGVGCSWMYSLLKFACM